jgi:DNA polymerase
MAEISQRPERESITYAGINQITKKWGKVRTHGAKLVENAVQAAARDVICDMALHIVGAGLGELVLSVHDELIFEVPEKEAEDRLKTILDMMCVAPAWAPGLPVKAEGDVMDLYGK